MKNGSWLNVEKFIIAIPILIQNRGTKYGIIFAWKHLELVIYMVHNILACSQTLLSPKTVIYIIVINLRIRHCDIRFACLIICYGTFAIYFDDLLVVSDPLSYYLDSAFI